MTTTNDEYNGWANRETWALNLVLGGDEGLYLLTREAVADAVKGLWEELTDPAEGLLKPEYIIDLLREVGSDWRIDWAEIGQAWIPEPVEVGTE